MTNNENHINEKTDMDIDKNEDNDDNLEEDFDFEKLKDELAQSGMEIQYVQGNNFQEMINDDELIDVKEEEMTNDDESFKNDEDYKQMLERKEKIEVNAFPNFEAEGEIYSIGIDEGRKTVLVGDGEENFYRINLENNEVEVKEKLFKDSIISIKYSYDKSLFLVASIDGTIKVFDSNDFSIVSEVNDNSDEILWTDWHPKGLVFAIGTSSGSCLVYNSKDGECIKSLYGHSDSCSAGLFSLDGKSIITSSHDRSVKVWELKTPYCKFTFKGLKFHKADILCMAIGSKKNIVATGSGYNEVGIVNYETGSVSINI